jgi:hypothetical protein
LPQSWQIGRPAPSGNSDTPAIHDSTPRCSCFPASSPACGNAPRAPDPRRGANAIYSIADIAIAAFAVFFMQSPSFLAAQQRLREGHGRSNAETLFSLTRIPSDNHIRNMLDPAAPSLLDPAFTAALDELEQSGNLDTFRILGDHLAIALDGTEYYCSDKLHCAQCSKRQRSNGRTEYFHTMLSATLVAPGHNHVLPLPPEFVAPQDGAAKQDCESRAARRWLATHGPRHTPGLTRSISATTCSPTSRCATRCSPSVAISCSSASRSRTR